MIKPLSFALPPHSFALKLLSFALALLTVSALAAQNFVWQPSPGHAQIPIWPSAAPDPQPVTGPEFAESSGKDFLVAGQPVVSIERVSRPTMTVYSPTGKNTGAAIVVFPGGGYYDLAIDLEGTEVCDWLTPQGITCIVLKYRVPGDPPNQVSGLPYPKSGPYPEAPQALEDAQRTLGLVRLHAAQWHIDPNEIGVLGFSAGGHLVAAISNHFARRLYSPVDAADALSCRPDFAVAIYPGHLSLGAAEYDAGLGVKPFAIPHPQPETDADRQYGLNPDLHVTRQTPPTFLLQNEDDHVDNVDDALSYYIALKTAGVPVEMHLYAQGGHAFGLRRTRLPVTAWPDLLDTWLQTLGMLANPAH